MLCGEWRYARYAHVTKKNDAPKFAARWGARVLLARCPP
jgi:hypothetical protein